MLGKRSCVVDALDQQLDGLAVARFCEFSNLAPEFFGLAYDLRRIDIAKDLTKITIERTVIDGKNWPRFAARVSNVGVGVHVDLSSMKESAVPRVRDDAVELLARIAVEG